MRLRDSKILTVTIGLAVCTLACLAAMATFAWPLPAETDDSNVPRCRVHRAELFLDVVPVMPGYAPSGPDYEQLQGFSEASYQLFPNARRWVPGSCVQGFAPVFTEVAFCAMCRKAEAEWVTANFGEGPIAPPSAVQLTVAPEPAPRKALSRSKAVAPAR